MRMHTSFRFVRDDMQQELRPAGCGESLGALAVQLLSLERADFEHGARRASNLGLAGIYQLGLTEMRIAFEEWNPVLLDALARARRREVADGLASIRHAGQVLSALVVGGVQPVVLKGLPL